MANQRELVEAAARVFRTKGYHSASVQDIADEVGILKGSLYHYVRSKEELLYLVIREPISRLYRTVEEVASSDAAPAEKLRRAIEAHLQAFDDHYPDLFVYLRETEDLRKRFRAQTQLSPKHYERLWQQILEEGVKAGVFRSDLDVKVVSYGLLGMLNWLYKWYDPKGRLGSREVARQFAAVALRGLTGSEGPARGRAARPRRGGARQKRR